MFRPVSCNACGTTVGSVRDGKLKISVRSRLVAIAKSGRAEINCPECKATVHLPLVYKQNFSKS